MVDSVRFGLSISTAAVDVTVVVVAVVGATAEDAGIGCGADFGSVCSAATSFGPCIGAMFYVGFVLFRIVRTSVVCCPECPVLHVTTNRTNVSCYTILRLCMPCVLRITPAKRA